MQITISKEAEAEFLDNLINDLSNENNESSSSKYYKIDKDVINYILGENRDSQEELNDIIKNLYAFLEQNKFIVSDLLEQKATDEDKQEGLDLADYLIKHNYKRQYMSKDMQNLDKLINQNPNLLQLIDVFGLELR